MKGAPGDFDETGCQMTQKARGQSRQPDALLLVQKGLMSQMEVSRMFALASETRTSSILAT